MVKNEELIKFVFKESRQIKNSKKSYIFLEQLLNSDSSFIINTNLEGNLFIWENGTWKDGTWKDGFWKKGTWENGVWENGYWEGGSWKKGTWKNGTWENGTWENGTWLKGKIWNKNINKYQKSELPPNQVEWSLSYGKK